MVTFFALMVLASLVFLIWGIISPKVPSKIVRRSLTRKGVLAVFGGSFLFFFVAFAMTVPPVEKKPVEMASTVSSSSAQVENTVSDTLPIIEEQNQVTSTETQVPTSTIEQVPNGETPIVTSESSKTELETPKTENAEELYLVTKVVDGDTFDVSIKGQTKRIRLIGVDTPETVDPRKAVQCFGKEASNKAVELLLNKKVKLEADSTQGELDKYGRLLRYAIREDGLFYNKWMIENGYAHEYTYNKPYKYQTEFKNAQKEAQTQKRGLWADNACPTAPVEETKAVTPTPVAPVTSGPTVAPTGACNIKGNINSEGRKIYHLPNCPNYKATKIEESQGEKWFCSEQEAVKAGWTKAGNC